MLFKTVNFCKKLNLHKLKNLAYNDIKRKDGGEATNGG